VAQAWQQALSAELAAVFGYGLLGPHLRAGEQVTLARACQQQHRALRDSTAADLLAVAQTVPTPLADYPSMFPVADELSAQRLATRLEDAAAAAWRYLIATAAGLPPGSTSTTNDTSVAKVRATALAALSASAVRAMRWRALVNPNAPTVPFPGI